jgi:hypothetical protein
MNVVRSVPRKFDAVGTTVKIEFDDSHPDSNLGCTRRWNRRVVHDRLRLVMRLHFLAGSLDRPLECLAIGGDTAAVVRMEAQAELVGAPL